MKTDHIEIEVLKEVDSTVSCIYALSQVMDHYTCKPIDEKLSPMGKDIRSIYQWFVERYNPKCDIDFKI